MISFHCYYVLFYFKSIVLSLFCFIGLEAHLIWIPTWAYFGHYKGPSSWLGPQFKLRQLPCPTLQHRSPKPSRSGLAITRTTHDHLASAWPNQACVWPALTQQKALSSHHHLNGKRGPHIPAGLLRFPTWPTSTRPYLPCGSVTSP